MKVQDVLTFRDDLYFEGAVQADWFYQQAKAEAVASSFVFHGPATHAVSQSEVGGRGLIDTASFALKLAEKADGVDTGSPFTLAIAGYGTGKSHLAVTLSQLFSGSELNVPLHQTILKNIARADKSIAARLEPRVRRPRLVLALNGMRDFNLHYELLRTAEKSLRLSGSSLDVLTKLNKVKETALLFIERSFLLLQQQFNQSADKHDISFRDDELRAYLTNHLDEPNSTVFDIVGEVYSAFNGHAIRLDEGVSAAAVLDTLLAECCGTHGQFESILILFDEFGRYLEYVAANPAAAGDSALQQIFESVQNAQGDIQFVGFIQSDIKSYLQRVDKSSNISRYIDRFDAGEKVYLSSNLETIFANLLERKNQEAYQQWIGERLEGQETSWRKLYDDMTRWLPLHGIWAKWEDFHRVILCAIYPLHPLSTYLLCCLTDWLQNRSSLTLLNEKVKLIGEMELSDKNPLPLIYPVELLKGAFFEELLSAEEQGRQRSQFCILLSNIFRKFDTKLSDAEKDVLLANLILRVCRFRFAKRADLDTALCACTNLSQVQVQTALKLLEDEYAVLSYDDRMICFDFIADSVGASDFRNYLRMTKNHLHFSSDMLQQENILLCAGIFEPLQTNFSAQMGIQTSEWVFAQRIVHRSHMDTSLLDQCVKQLHSATEPNVPKGQVLWVYVEKEATASQLEQLEKLISCIPSDTALCIFLLDDAEEKLCDAILELHALAGMSADDRGRFHKFYEDALSKAVERLTAQFSDLKQERKRVCSDGICSAAGRMTSVLTDVFEQIYPKVLPFDFEGFQLKSIAKASKQFCAIIKWMLMESMKFQSLKSQPVEVRNRVESLLGRKGLHAWRAVNDDWSGIVPMHERVRNVYTHLTSQLQDSQQLAFEHVISMLTSAPYGMNDYAVFLMLALLSQNMSYTTKLEFEGKWYNCANWAEFVVSDKKIDMRRLAQTRLHLIDVAEAENRFKSLFREINNNIDMTQVPEYRHRLEELEKEETIPETLASDYALANLRLADGEKALSAFEAAVDRIQRELSSANKEHDAYAGMHAAVEAQKLAESDASNTGSYAYSGSQLNELLSYAQRGRELAERDFEQWIPEQRCGSLTRLEVYQKHVRKVIDLMNSLGYMPQARALRSIADYEMENTRLLAEQMSLKENCDLFLKTSTVLRGQPIRALQAQLERGEELKNVFDSFDYQKSRELKWAYGELIQRLNEVHAAIDQQKQQLQSVWDAIFDIHGLQDVEMVTSRIRGLLDSGLDEKDRADFEETLNTYDGFLREISAIHNCGDDPQRLEATYLSLKSIYPEDEDENLAEVIEEQYQEARDRLSQKSKRWCDEFLTINPQIMDEHELDQWIKKTQPLPIYLDNDTCKAYEAMENKVKGVLSEKRIDYILLLYHQLTDSEKAECLRRIQ